MRSVYDVAAYILQKSGELTTWKLQKLVYYSQAWSLVWDERALFPNRIEAWANGPVVPDLYRAHSGTFKITSTANGDPEKLDDLAKETIDSVLSHYGDKSSQWQSNLTHREAPWRDARIGLADGERGSVEITFGALADFYGAL